MVKKYINYKNYCCDYSFLMKDNTILKVNNRACWGYLQDNLNTSNIDYILINDFEVEETKKYIPILINNINKITECQLVVINNIKYIKYKPLTTYDQNLILLNFIRNLWYSNITYNHNHIAFFEELKKSRYKDPLMRLTKANIKACKNYKTYQNHNNCTNGHKLKLKTTKQLINYKGESTLYFLTN